MKCRQQLTKKGSHEDAAQFVSKSADAYKKAIALDASYMDAYFNLGALYYNEAAELNNIANKIEDAHYTKRRKQKLMKCSKLLFRN